MKKAKFNTMDFVIILVVVLVVAAAGYFFVSSTGASTGSGGSGSKDVTSTIEVEFIKNDLYMTELPQVGDKVTIGAKEKMPATVVGVRAEPAKVVSYDLENGSAGWAEIPDKYDIYVTLEANAVDDGDAININNSPIRVGDPNAVRSQGWAGYGYVTKLDVTE